MSNEPFGIDRTPGHVNKITNRLKELTDAVDNASKSSTRVAIALNVLTFMLVLVAVVTLWIQTRDYRVAKSAESAAFIECMTTERAAALEGLRAIRQGRSDEQLRRIAESMAFLSCDDNS